MQCLEQNITRYDAYCTAKEAKHFMILQLLSHLAAQLPPDSTVVDIGAASHDLSLLQCSACLMFHVIQALCMVLAPSLSCATATT